MIFQKTPKDGAWHRYSPWFFVRLNDGRLSHAIGDIRRRWTGTMWEYEQDPETVDQFDARQY